MTAGHASGRAVHGLPPEAEYVRSTPRFTNDNVPPGLLRAHEVAGSAWAVLYVDSGRLRFTWEDTAEVIAISAGDPFLIAPGRKHHLELSEPVRFHLDFYRA